MSEDKKEEVKEETKDEKKEEPKEEGSKSATIEDVKKIVNDAIESVKSVLGGDGDSGDSKKEDKEDGESSSGPRSQFGQSLAAKEAEAESKIKEAIKGVLEERDHKKEHEEIKKVKDTIEKSPVKVRKLTKLMLGKNFDYDK